MKAADVASLRAECERLAGLLAAELGGRERRALRSRLAAATRRLDAATAAPVAWEPCEETSLADLRRVVRRAEVAS